MSVETVQTFPTEHKFDDQALFDDAEAIEAPDTPEAAEAEIEQPKPEPVVAVAAETPAERPVVDDNAPLVPSWRLREINEEKRAAQAELEQLRAERAQWQQRQQAPAREEKPAEKPARPDPLLDPDGYAAFVKAEARQEILAERREDSLQRARKANQKDFDEAYAAAQQAVDPALRARMQASRDPGETLLEWHRENKTRQEIGGDLNAYKQRIREEALKDAEFRKAAIAAWSDEAQPLTNGRPNVALPPSLSGASRSAAVSAVDDDISDEGLWRHANA